MHKRIMTLYAETFVHVGAGSSTGVVDLPIQREIHTDFPMVSGSGLKGSLRSMALSQEGFDVNTIFGPDTRSDDKHIGSLIVGDAKILAFPVRSMPGTFVWVTSPLVLERFRRDTLMTGFEVSFELPDVDKEEALVSPDTQLPERILAEELDFTVVRNSIMTDIAEYILDFLPEGIGNAYRAKFAKDLLLVSDDTFTHFVKYATQISARIQLNPTSKTTANNGNLWYEETLPPETIMYTTLMADKPKSTRSNLADGKEVLEKVVSEVLHDGHIQIGGNETVGQGWCLTKVRGV